ncbi:MAG: nucleotide exchange factor GrpE [Tissierellia bacterium]|nr:nucleotide exchange factor GrpE [Tissierellia bacterium]
MEEEKKEEMDQDVAEEESSEEVETKEDDGDEQYEALKNSFVRLQADFSNYKKRIEREKSQQIRLAGEGVIMKLLPIIDDLDRAIDNSDEEDEFVQGIALIRDSFLQVLESEGLEEIPSDGEKFDPNLHHAVVTEESDKEADKVLETFQKGYRLHDKVIRPAMVKVSK